MLAVFKRLPTDFECSWVGEGPKLRDVMAGKYDILFGVGHPRELPAILLRPRKTKYILHYQSVLLKKSEPGWRVRMPWPIRKLIFSQADMAIMPSAFSAGTVRQFFPRLRVEYVLNGIDSAFFHPGKKNLPYLKEKFGIDTSKPLVTFIGGALQIRKRPDIFINIARRFSPTEATFVAVGRPVPEHDFLTGTEHITNFKSVPLMSREEVAICLASSKVFVFPSLREPAALVNLEAMASGAVPVVSQSGGNVEFMQDGVSGFYVSHDDKEEDVFVARIKSLLADEKLRQSMSAAARRAAEGQTWDVAAKKYEALFRSLVA